MKKVKILGAGCSKCAKLYELTKDVIEKENIDAEVEKITDMNEIIGYGIMSIPAFVVDEKIISVGKLLSTKEIKEILTK